MELLYIHWNPDPILFSIAGIAIRWYSIFWFIAILAGSQVVSIEGFTCRYVSEFVFIQFLRYFYRGTVGTLFVL